MKKILLLMLTLLMSVTTWAAEPYFELISGSFESCSVTLKVTFPDATTVEAEGMTLLHEEWNLADHGYASMAYEFNPVIVGNTMTVLFSGFDYLSDDSKYYLRPFEVKLDGVGYSSDIYVKQPEPYAETINGTILGDMEVVVKVTVPTFTTFAATTSVPQYRYVYLKYDGTIEARTTMDHVTSEGNTMTISFSCYGNASGDTDASKYEVNFSDYSAVGDGRTLSEFSVYFINDSGNSGDGGEDLDDDEPDLTNYFWVKNTSMSDVTIVVNGENGNIEYTYTPENTRSWVAVGDDTKVININFSTHDKVYFRAGESGNTTMNDVFWFESRYNASYSVGGDITTLLDRAGNVETLTENGTFANMFANDKYLSDASELVLPSTTLSPYCYSGMFAVWESWLQAAPETLPAMNLAEECYSSMFANCSMLTKAPELPATTLAPNCYNNMFNDCSSLLKAPVLPATQLVEGCYSSMFSGCSNIEPVIFAYIEDYEMYWPTNNFTTGNPMKDWVYNTPSGMTIYTNLKNWSESYRQDILGVTNVPLIAREMETKEDPDNSTTYYTTFFDSEFAYEIPAGVIAYTATISGSSLIMSPIEGGIIPAGEGVLLKLNDDEYSHDYSTGLGLGHFYMNRTLQSADVNPANVLTGSDIDTPAPADCYILSYGQSGLGFYRYSGSLTANKAYLTIPAGAARALNMVFGDNETDGINNVDADENGNSATIYNLSGIRLNQIQNGINIVNGKKVIIK